MIKKVSQQNSSSLYDNLIWLNNWSCHSSNNFAIKNWLFGYHQINKYNTIKNKSICISQGIALNEAGSWSFGNELTRNIIFGADNSSSINSCW